MSALSELKAALDNAKRVVTDTQAEKLHHYLVLLEKWNRVHNLTSVRTLSEMIPAHIIDSLQVLPFVQASRVVDVGTGAGLPGIPLAIMLAKTTFVLVDSNQKKLSFVEQAIQELSLPNVSVVHARVERYQPEQPFELVVSRAFASLPTFLSLSKHLCQKNGKLFAMKAEPPEKELVDLKKQYAIKVIELQKTPKARSLIVISQEEPC